MCLNSLEKEHLLYGFKQIQASPVTFFKKFKPKFHDVKYHKMGFIPSLAICYCVLLENLYQAVADLNDFYRHDNR